MPTPQLFQSELLSTPEYASTPTVPALISAQVSGGDTGELRKNPNQRKIRNQFQNSKHDIGYVMSLIPFEAII